MPLGSPDTPSYPHGRASSGPGCSESHGWASQKAEAVNNDWAESGAGRTVVPFGFCIEGHCNHNVTFVLPMWSRCFTQWIYDKSSAVCYFSYLFHSNAVFVLTFVTYRSTFEVAWDPMWANVILWIPLKYVFDREERSNIFIKKLYKVNFIQHFFKRSSCLAGSRTSPQFCLDS